MSKGDGLAFCLLGLIAAIVGLFFEFYNNGVSSLQSGTAIAWMVQNISAYFTALNDIGTIFTSNIWSGFIVLNPLITLLGLILVLFGLNTESTSRSGAIILLIMPLAYLILEIIIPVIGGASFPTLFGYVGIGFYLQVVGALLVFIGSARNNVN